jgi:hypothetical protein
VVEIVLQLVTIAMAKVVEHNLKVWPVMRRVGTVLHRVMLHMLRVGTLFPLALMLRMLRGTIRQHLVPIAMQRAKVQ